MRSAFAGFPNWNNLISSQDKYSSQTSPETHTSSLAFLWYLFCFCLNACSLLCTVSQCKISYRCWNVDVSWWCLLSPQKTVSHKIKAFYSYLFEMNCIADGLLNFDGTFVMHLLFEGIIVATFMFSVTLLRSKIRGEVYLFSYCLVYFLYIVSDSFSCFLLL